MHFGKAALRNKIAEGFDLKPQQRRFVFRLIEHQEVMTQLSAEIEQRKPQDGNESRVMGVVQDRMNFIRRSDSAPPLV